MPRDFKVHLTDIIEAALRIETYLEGLDFNAFSLDSKTVDAVVRNLEIIGEAAKKVPDEFRMLHPTS